MALLHITRVTMDTDFLELFPPGPEDVLKVAGQEVLRYVVGNLRHGYILTRVCMPQSQEVKV